MKLMCWNYRGLRNPHAVQTLKFLILSKKSSIVFVFECKLHVREINYCFHFPSLPNHFVVDANDRRGSLLLFWANDINIRLSPTQFRILNICF